MNYSLISIYRGVLKWKYGVSFRYLKRNLIIITLKGGFDQEPKYMLEPQ